MKLLASGVGLATVLGFQYLALAMLQRGSTLPGALVLALGATLVPLPWYWFIWPRGRGIILRPAARAAAWLLVIWSWFISFAISYFQTGSGPSHLEPHWLLSLVLAWPAFAAGAAAMTLLRGVPLPPDPQQSDHAPADARQN